MLESENKNFRHKERRHVCMGGGEGGRKQPRNEKFVEELYAGGPPHGRSGSPVLSECSKKR